jgi:hypothetical protein
VTDAAEYPFAQSERDRASLLLMGQTKPAAADGLLPHPLPAWLGRHLVAAHSIRSSFAVNMVAVAMVGAVFTGRLRSSVQRGLTTLFPREVQSEESARLTKTGPSPSRGLPGMRVIQREIVGAAVLAGL